MASDLPKDSWGLDNIPIGRVGGGTPVTHHHLAVPGDESQGVSESDADDVLKGSALDLDAGILSWQTDEILPPQPPSAALVSCMGGPAVTDDLLFLNTVPIVSEEDRKSNKENFVLQSSIRNRASSITNCAGGGNTGSGGIKPVLGLPSAFSIVAGIVIGSGIFVSPVGILKHMNTPFGAIVVWIICGMVATIGGICYVELATMLKKGAGDFSYIYAAFGRLPAFLFLWVVIMVIAPTSIAVLARTFATYLMGAVRYAQGGEAPETEDPVALMLIAIVVVLLVVAINIANINFASSVQIIFTLAKTLSLFLICIMGGYSCGTGLYNGEGCFKAEAFYQADWASERGFVGVIKSFSLAFFAGIFSYAGWNNVTYVTDEVKKPEKTLPRAILSAIPCITGVYVTVNLAYFAVLTPPEIESASAVAVDFAKKFHGSFAWIAAGFVMISTFGSINGMLYVMSRLCFVGARNGMLPRILATVHIRRMTPVPAILLLFCIVLIYLTCFRGGINTMLEYESFVELLLINLTVTGLFRLRWKHPDWPRPFRVPVILPVIFIGFVTFTMIVSIWESWLNSLIGLTLLATGVPIYFVFNYTSPSPGWQLRFARLQIQIQKLLLVAPIEELASDNAGATNQPLTTIAEENTGAATPRKDDGQCETNCGEWSPTKIFNRNNKKQANNNASANNDDASPPISFDSSFESEKNHLHHRVNAASNKRKCDDDETVGQKLLSPASTSTLPVNNNNLPSVEAATGGGQDELSKEGIIERSWGY